MTLLQAKLPLPQLRVPAPDVGAVCWTGHCTLQSSHRGYGAAAAACCAATTPVAAWRWQRSSGRLRSAPHSALRCCSGSGSSGCLPPRLPLQPRIMGLHRPLPAPPAFLPRRCCRAQAWPTRSISACVRPYMLRRGWLCAHTTGRRTHGKRVRGSLLLTGCWGPLAVLRELLAGCWGASCTKFREPLTAAECIPTGTRGKQAWAWWFNWVGGLRPEPGIVESFLTSKMTMASPASIL
jgi:hypothetical protein